jgi:hypothetical protein
MADRKEIVLGNGWHTLYSDEVWYFVIACDSDEVVLEARFQSDAPDRTGYPAWAGTEFCATKAGEEAICRVPYTNVAEFLAAGRLSFVPESIWAKAVEECRKLEPSSDG